MLETHGAAPTRSTAAIGGAAIDFMGLLRYAGAAVRLQASCT